MLTLHHLKSSQSFRIVWLFEELGMQYDLKIYKRVNLLAPEEYKRISPLGTSPTITDSDNGLALSESNAIIDYILDKAGPSTLNLRPAPGSPDRTRYLFWFHSMQGSLQPLLLIDALFLTIPKNAPWPVSSLLNVVGKKTRESFTKPRLTKLLDLAEENLTQDQFLAGPRFTAADITAIYPMDATFSLYPEYSTKYPMCKAWLDRMYARPHFQAALKKIGEEKVSL
jgi:glutathione S-transferase